MCSVLWAKILSILWKQAEFVFKIIANTVDFAI